MQNLSDILSNRLNSLNSGVKTTIKDKYLDDLLSVINTCRIEAGYKPYTYPRLQKDLQKLGKSKKSWDRNIYIASVLDSKNPCSRFFWDLKQVKKL